MPPIFKALATIMAWAFWIVCWVMGLSIFIKGVVSGDLYGTEPAPMAYPVGFAVALAWGIGAAVVMLIRKKLE